MSQTKVVKNSPCQCMTSKTKKKMYIKNIASLDSGDYKIVRTV